MFLTDLGKVYGCGMNFHYQINKNNLRDDLKIAKSTIISESDFDPLDITHR